jgi:hypothetical protein
MRTGNELELFHPDTKVRLDFESMDYLSLLDLMHLCQDRVSTTQFKMHSIRERGDEPSVALKRFLLYTQATISKCERTILAQGYGNYDRLAQALEVLSSADRELIWERYNQFIKGERS